MARLKEALQKGTLGGDPHGALLTHRADAAAIIFKTDSKHLKLVSQLYDGCQETFFHYCDFLEQAFDDQVRCHRPHSKLWCTITGWSPAWRFISIDPC